MNGSDSATAPTSSDMRTMQIIRLALLSGVLTFGVVIFYLVNTNPPDASAVEEMRPLLYVFIALLLGAAVGVVVLRGKLASGGGLPARSILILGWALSEGVTLVGAVYFLMTGTPIAYVAGLGLMVATLFVLLPVPQNSPDTRH